MGLRACVEAQIQTGAPLLLSGRVSREVLAVLDGTGGPPGTGAPCLWQKCAFFDVPPDSPVSPTELASLGAFIGLCPPNGGADLAWRPYRARRPWRTEEALLSSLTGAAAKMLVSSGVRFRTDLRAHGGPGLGHAPELLHMAKERIAPASSDVLRASALEFLQYPWKPPPPPEVVVHSIWCHWCGTQKKLGDHFSKMGFDYCSPKCIAAHRKVDFDKDKRLIASAA
eukprot:gnl/TRDRNA2_/TRDRNA2_165553_c1_seq1.p1 gnl/TRDRNA2_/TRDRNA2_165553_c1~~gnl/TRDRNA2_/TRDRNA2_165553_c1_seq1.p1  ORF type:complete len:235 (+),score=39.39 gnl/TRDRNA2_/TRDRNA2_165553_c1_seq1:29-706(+)